MLVLLSGKEASRRVRVLHPFWVVEADGARRVVMPGEEFRLPWGPAADAVAAKRAEYADVAAPAAVVPRRPAPAGTVVSMGTGAVIESEVTVRITRPCWVIADDGSKRVADVGEVIKMSRWDAGNAVNALRAEYVND